MIEMVVKETNAVVAIVDCCIDDGNGSSDDSGSGSGDGDGSGVGEDGGSGNGKKTVMWVWGTPCDSTSNRCDSQR